MKLRLALGRLFAAALLFGVVGCGDVFRPVVNPLLTPGGTSAQNKLAFVLSTTGSGTPGVLTALDVSGDTIVSQLSVGRGPSYETFSSGSLYIADQFDSTLSVASGFISLPGLGLAPPVTKIALPAGLLGAPGASACPNTTGIPSVNAMVVGGNYLYVAESARSLVAAVSTTSNSLAQEIPVSSIPVFLASVPVVGKVYSVNAPTSDLSSFLTQSNAIATSSIKVGTCPMAAVTNAGESRLFVTNQGSGTISVIDTSTDQVVGTITVGKSPVGLAFGSQTNSLFVANQASGTVSVVNVDTSQPNPNFGAVTNIPVGGAPAYVVVSPDGSRAYVLNLAPDAQGRGHIDVIDGIGNSSLGTIPVGRTPISMAQATDGSKIYVVNQADSSVTIVSTQPNTITGLSNAIITLTVPEIGTAVPLQVFVQP